VKFSIITICLNAEDYIAETMASIVGQDYDDLEYIIVDGGSKDGSLEKISSLAQHDNRVAWTSGNDQGISDAMNKGLSMATGDVVAFLHADDSYAATDVISEVTQAFAKNAGSCWVTGGINETDARGVQVRTVHVRRFSRRRLLRNNIILHPATFVRRKAIEQVGGFDPSLRYAMDYDLWLRLASLGPPVELNRTLTNFRVHAHSCSSANRAAALREEYQIRRKYLCGPVSRAGHALYHIWRVVHLLISTRKDNYSHAPQG
jgi:glycosyltransferase involved in cell wall biosynthesis